MIDSKVITTKPSFWYNGFLDSARVLRTDGTVELLDTKDYRWYISYITSETAELAKQRLIDFGYTFVSYL